MSVETANGADCTVTSIELGGINVDGRGRRRVDIETSIEHFYTPYDAAAEADNRTQMLAMSNPQP